MGTPMVRSKREWVCSNCAAKYIKWNGVCYRGCKFSGTLQENVLIAGKPKRVATGTTKQLIRRAKESERDIAKRMVAADGPDPAFRNIASSTGRIGFITGMMIDAVSRTYVTENKNRKMPTWLIDAWVKINQRAYDFNKNALLHIEPPNMPREYLIQGSKQKLDTMAIITQTRHEDLIKCERNLSELLLLIENDPKYLRLQNLFLDSQKNQT